MKRTAVLLVLVLGVVPLTGCQLLLLPFIGAIFGPGCTNQEVKVPDGTPDSQHFAGSYHLDQPTADGTIELDLSADLADAGRYDVTGSATFGGSDYAVEGEVLAGSCEDFVPQTVTPQNSPPPRRTMALRLTETSATTVAYTILAVGSTTTQPAYLATGAISYDHPLNHAPYLGDAEAGKLDFTPLPY